MSCIKFTTKGDLSNIKRFLEYAKDENEYGNIKVMADKGVEALRAATPKRTGKTADSWKYKITRNKGMCRIEWYNTNENANYNIAMLIQMGHGTGAGVYVSGIDYINPALRPVFEEIEEYVWKGVTEA